VSSVEDEDCSSSSEEEREEVLSSMYLRVECEDQPRHYLLPDRGR
jgi:hypothetical protein